MPPILLLLAKIALVIFLIEVVQNDLTNSDNLKRIHVLSMDFLEMIDLVKKSHLRCQLPYFVLNNIHLHRHVLLPRFVLLLSGDINLNPGPMNAVCNNIHIYVLPFNDSNESTKLLRQPVLKMEIRQF